MKTFPIAPLSVALLLAVSANSHAAFDPAQFGALDINFGSQGKQTTSFSPWNDVAHDVALQSNGKVVLAGHANNTDGTDEDFALLRYNADGNLDTTFGTGGKLTTYFFATPNDKQEQAEAVAIQADGKIVAAGWTINPQGQAVFALARYNVDGTLDKSFDTDGLVTTKLRAKTEDDADYIRDVVIQPDGKIVVTGMSYDSVKGSSDFATARYLTSGALDTSFGTNGIVITPIGESDDGASGLVLQPDGKLVAAGASCNSLDCDTTNGNYDFAFVRYNTDGSLDKTFNDDGKAAFSTAILLFSDGASRVTLQPDGRIVAAGGRMKGDDNYRQRGDFALVRLTANGQLDTSFGQMGWVKTPIGLDVSGAADLAYRVDGKLVVVGAAEYNTVNSNFAMAMYNSNGSLDMSFGQAASGIVTTTFGATPSAANAVMIQPNGYIVVAGVADSTAYHEDFAAARYMAPDLTPNAFGFTPLGSQEVSTKVESASLIISGFDASTPISVKNGEYRINGGEFTSAPGMLSPGDQVTVRQTTSSSFNTTNTSVVTVGGVSGDFSTTTRAQAESGGGGAVGLEGLALFGIPLLAWARRRMGGKAK
jgi:uncharacterized delta-60 repeat protein